MTARRSVPVLAVAFSLALHAAAFAALVADWRKETPAEPALSVELVIVASPLESEAIDAPAAGEPPKAELPAEAQPAPAAEPQPPQPPPPQKTAEPPPPPAPPVQEAPKQVKKPEPPAPQPKPVAKQQTAPRGFEAPITLNPGSLGDEPQQAKAPASAPAANSFSVLHGPIPPYPPLARNRGQEGRVVLDVAIGLDGVPRSVSVAQSSGVDLLDESAVTTVKTWRFRNDSGRVLTVSVPIVFELRSTARR